MIYPYPCQSSIDRIKRKKMRFVRRESVLEEFTEDEGFVNCPSFILECRN